MLRITKSTGIVTSFPGITPYEVLVLVVVVLIAFRLATTVVAVRPLSLLGKDGETEVRGSIAKIEKHQLAKITNRIGAAPPAGAEVIAKIPARANLDKIKSRQLVKITNRIGAAESTGNEVIAKIPAHANLDKINGRQLAKIINRADQHQPARILLSEAFKRGGNFAKI